MDEATSAAASPTGRCAFILSITDLFLQRPLTTTTPSSPAAFPGRQDSRRSCSPPPLPTTVALATPSPEKAAGPLPYAGHRRRTHSKSPADGPDKRRAPRGAGELGRRTRAARATVRFLCASSAPREVSHPVDRLSADRAGTRSDGAEPPLMMPLSDIGADQLADVGGKALNLAELLRGGFRIPPGFCLTTHAYERVADQAGLGRRLDELAATPADDVPRSAGSPTPSPAWCWRPRCRTRSQTAVAAAYRQLGRRRAGRGALVGHRRGPAVRQLRRPAGHLPRRRRRATRCSTPYGAAGRRCGPTAPSPTAPRNGIDHRTVRLAVVVQQMVDADGRRRAVHRQPGHRPAPRRPSSTPAPASARRWSPARSTRTTSSSTPPAAQILERRLGDKRLAIRAAARRRHRARRARRRRRPVVPHRRAAARARRARRPGRARTTARRRTSSGPSTPTARCG